MAKHIPKVSHKARHLGIVAVSVLCVTLADAAADAGSVVVNRQRDMKEIAVAANHCRDVQGTRYVFVSYLRRSGEDGLNRPGFAGDRLA